MRDVVYDAVKKRAQKKGISIYELEKRIGIASGSIIKWNDSIPRSDRLYSVAAILGCSVDDLLAEAKIKPCDTGGRSAEHGEAQ